MSPRSPDSIGQRVKLVRKRLGWTQGELAKAAGEKQPNISKLERGEIQTTTAIARLADALRVAPRWLELGEGPEPGDWTPTQHPSEGVGAHPVAQELSPLRRDDAPVRIEWERILKDPLKREFQTTMPDASMEPDIPRGAGIIFVTDLQPAPGDWVLIRDRDGSPFVRELRQVKPGRWEAHALNPAFLPMDSERDGLQVLAVFDGLRGRKARV